MGSPDVQREILDRAIGALKHGENVIIFSAMGAGGPALCKKIFAEVPWVLTCSALAYHGYVDEEAPENDPWLLYSIRPEPDRIAGFIQVASGSSGKPFLFHIQSNENPPNESQIVGLMKRAISISEIISQRPTRIFLCSYDNRNLVLIRDLLMY